MSDMQSKISGLSAEEKRILLTRLLKEKAAKPKSYPLSFSQERLWFLHNLEGENSTYNMWITLRFEGKIQPEMFQKAVNEIVKRHEVLRSTFRMEDDEPIQVVAPQLSIPLPVEDLRQELEHAETKEREERLLQHALAEVEQPFDLTAGPLLRVKLIRFRDDRHLLLLTMHHIISDAWSMKVFVQELTLLYNAYIKHMENPTALLPKLKLQYGDYAKHQRQFLAGENMEKQVQYWKERLIGAPPLLELPTDYPRPMLQSFRGGAIPFTIDANLTGQLRQLSRETGTTLFMVLMASFALLLGRCSATEDIVVGSPVANREKAEYEPLIGFFISTMILRTDLTGDPTFRELLERVKGICLEAYRHQDVPFEKLVEELNPDRHLSHSPLFQVLFALQNVQVSSGEQEGLTITPFDIRRRTAKYDLFLALVESGKEITADIEYSADLFRADTIQRMITYLLRLLETIVKEPQLHLSHISFLGDDDRRLLVEEWNATETEYPKDKTICQLFWEQSRLTPEATAVIYENLETGERQSLTYSQLGDMGTCLAARLKKEGVVPGTVVAIMVEPSVEMIVAILAVFKVGGLYLPIDYKTPVQRIHYMLKDSGAQFVLTREALVPVIQGVPGLEPGEKASQAYRFIDLKAPELFDPADIEAAQKEAGYCVIPKPGDAAYVIYTSGSTGRPKGVIVEHWNVVNFITAMSEIIPFEAGKTILALTTISFDIFVLETLLPLSCGLAIVVADESLQNDPDLLAQIITSNQVDMLQLTPSRLQLLISGKDGAAPLKGIKQLMIGGEAFPIDLLSRLREEFQGDIYNMYGPTETTVWSAVKNLTGLESVTIGEPVANTRIYIMGKGGEVQPIGIPGELCIGGDGVTRGYLNQPQLTADRFIPNPYVDGRRMYCTGDLARRLPDGDIQFLGRTDFQVKLRGYRIELEEIQSLLLIHPTVAEAVVVVQSDTTGDKFLCGYVVPAVDQTVDTTILKAHLAETLPEYMIPAQVVVLEKMPLTASGKIDRKALPEPHVCVSIGYEPPVTDTEKKLAGIWAEVLGVEEGVIGLENSFFDLGGHSLKAIRLTEKVHKELNVKVPLTEVFKKPRIKGLSLYIAGLSQDKFISIAPAGEKPYYALSSAQKRFYLLQQMDPGSTAYNLPSVDKLVGPLDRERFEEAFRRLIQRHESLRTSFCMVDGEALQKIHSQADFAIQYFEDVEIDDIPKEAMGVKAQSLAAHSKPCAAGVQGEPPPGARRTGAPGGPSESRRRHSTEAVERIIKDFIRPFDLDVAPLLRIGLIKLAQEEHVLMFDMHHIVTDGFSMGIFVKDFMALYARLQLPDLPLQYKDYSQWQFDRLASGQLKEQEAYWLKRFSGQLPTLAMPTDFPRPQVQSFEGDTLDTYLEKELTEKLRHLIKETGTTLYIVLLSIFNILLSKYSRQQDIVVGSTIAGRDHADLENVIGLLFETMAVRNYVGAEMTFREFLEDVKTVSLQAYENQAYPFGELVEKVMTEPDRSRNPLFDVMLIVQNVDTAPPDPGVGDLKIIPFEGESAKVAKLDMTIEARERTDRIEFHLEYCTKLYKRETMERFMAGFDTVASAMVENLDGHIKDLKMGHDLVQATASVYDDESTEFDF